MCTNIHHTVFYISVSLQYGKINIRIHCTYTTTIQMVDTPYFEHTQKKTPQILPQEVNYRVSIVSILGEFCYDWTSLYNLQKYGGIFRASSHVCQQVQSCLAGSETKYKQELVQYNQLCLLFHSDEDLPTLNSGLLTCTCACTWHCHVFCKGDFYYITCTWFLLM